MDKRWMLAMVGGAAVTALDKTFALAKPASPDGYFPDSVLYDQHGKPARFYSDLLHGKVVVVNMMYTVCSGICPANTRQLLDVQRALGSRCGRDVFLYSLTLRPDIDTPAALLDYANRYKVAPGWSFLTGKPSEVDAIRRKLGFFDTDPDADADIGNHTGALRVGNVARGRWMMMPNAAPAGLVVQAIQNIS